MLVSEFLKNIWEAEEVKAHLAEEVDLEGMLHT